MSMDHDENSLGELAAVGWENFTRLRGVDLLRHAACKIGPMVSHWQLSPFHNVQMTLALST